MDIMGMYYNIKYGLINLWKYKSIIWGDRDWDHSFLLKLMAFKMNNMGHLQEFNSHHVDAKKVADELYMASILCDLLADEDFDLHTNAFYEKYGHGTLEPWSSTITDENTDEFRQALDMDRYELEVAQDKLFELMKRYESWWD